MADLHLFTRRTDAPRYFDAIRGAAARSKTFVLGGDIFDFRWSTLGTTSATIEAAVGWLEELAAEHPACHFHYLLGNHDYHRRFIERLIEREGATANLSWHRFYLRLGDSLFLHGDAAGRRMTTEKLLRFRARWMHAEPPGRFGQQAYQLIFRAGLHRPVPYLIHPKRRVARRICRYLEHIGQGPPNGLRHVYFGHTHRRMLNYRYRGLVFHNGGAPIRGQRFRILEAVVS